MPWRATSAYPGQGKSREAGIGTLFAARIPREGQSWLIPDPVCDPRNGPGGSLQAEDFPVHLFQFQAKLGENFRYVHAFSFPPGSSGPLSPERYRCLLEMYHCFPSSTVQN